jgi:hypothetical protein
MFLFNIKKEKQINKFQTFNLNLSTQDRILLDNLKVKGESILTLRGLYRYDKYIDESLKHSFNIDEIKRIRIKNIIKNIINEFLTKTKQESGLIHLRISKPNDQFKIPRWHQDGSYFKGQKNYNIKLLTTLKGKSTLVSRWNKEAIDEEQKVWKLIEEKRANHMKASSNNWMRKFDKCDAYRSTKLKSLRIKLSKIVKHEPLNYDSAYSYVNGKYATMHSEPNITEDRIFLAVMPNSWENMQQCIANQILQKIEYS